MYRNYLYIEVPACEKKKLNYTFVTTRAIENSFIFYLDLLSKVDPLKDLTVSMHHRRLVTMACPHFVDEGVGLQIWAVATDVLNTAVKAYFSDFTIWLTNLYVKQKQHVMKCYASCRNFSMLRTR